ncbi:MAG TPA: SAM-dependent methyltransferase [Pseudonocardia sp.]|jgi:SAM-dependent methyltransferase|nr:SAM-dependent methyltransferase [Pseudonocardia sp.]
MVDDGPGLPPDYFTRPAQARVWNYLQGGTDNYPMDRSVADAMTQVYPGMADLAKRTRQMLMRAVRDVARDGRVRQFLDLGCGLPAPPGFADVHEIAESFHADARVVYVDNDRLVFTYATAWLRPTTPSGLCEYIEADARDTELILNQAAKTLDFDEPVGVIAFRVLGNIEYESSLRIVRDLMAAVPSGSHLLLSDGVALSDAHRESLRRRNTANIPSYTLRTPDEIGRYCDGLRLLEPGVVPVNRWRASPEEESESAAEQYAAVAVKP